MITYVSYATPRYYGELEQLLASADAVGVPCLGHRVPDRGSWEANTRYKAEFLYDVLETLREPIVWVDADARFRQRPILFDTLRNKVHLAVHFRQDAFTKKRGLEEELLSGTMYWEPCTATFELLEVWRAENQRNWNQWEQRNLQDLLKDPRFAHLKVHRLPKEYCLISGTDRGAMGLPEEAVIEHTQASRRLKS